MTFTKEEQIQAVYDLKVGYTLGHADIAILKGLARMALAGMEAVPVAWLWSNRKHPSEVTLVRPEDDERAEAAQWSGWSCQALYSTPQSATVLPETLPFPVMFQPGWRFGKGVRTQTMLDALQRRAEYYTELEAMTPEQRADHDAGVKGFTAMLNANHSVDANEKAKVEPVSNRDELPGWVACSERMPEEDGNYWGWWSESKRQGPVWFIKSELQSQFQSSEITHWMPLPAVPQQEVKP